RLQNRQPPRPRRCTKERRFNAKAFVMLRAPVVYAVQFMELTRPAPAAAAAALEWLVSGPELACSAEEDGEPRLGLSTCCHAWRTLNTSSICRRRISGLALICAS